MGKVRGTWKRQKCVCVRSVESRADRFADGSGVGGEIKRKSRMTQRF